MFKLMIVEDEKRIREGLATGFDWESLGFSISNVAANGAEALSLYKKNPPDVIMTDIRMPIMDGFELMEHIYRENKRMKFIVLSGYDLFEYAQKSIRFGVTQYLLKPVNENDLYPLMKSLYDDLRQSQRKWTGEANKSLLFKLSKQEMLEDKLRKLLYGNSVEFKLISELLTEIFPGINQNRMSIGVISFKNTLNIYNVYRYLMKHGRDSQRLFLMDGDFILCLLSVENTASSGQETIMANEVYDILGRYYPDRNSLENVVITWSNSFSGVSSIQSGYREALDLLKYSFYSTLGKVIQTPLIQNENDLSESADVSEALSIAIINENEVELSMKLREFLTSCSQQYLSKDILAFKFINIYKMIYKKLEEAKLPPIDEKSIFGKLVSLPDYTAFTKQIHALFNELFVQYQQSKIIAAQSFIQKVEIYISKNYGENLSLNSLSEIFHINASYLSYLFCKKTDVSLTNYIRNVRLENAKRLLTSSEYSIAEIAQIVGYKEYRHFSTIFKKEVGKTPKEFRFNSIMNK